MERTSRLHIAELVRVFDHGNNIQLLCSDTRGLLSVYLDPETFNMFNRAIHRAELKLKGLEVEFNREIVRVVGVQKRWSLCFSRVKYLDVIIYP